MTPLQEAFAGAIVVYLAWRVARAFFATSPVDNIPGPKSPSFLAGRFCGFSCRYAWTHLLSAIGHTAQVFGPDRWIYQEAFVKQYGRLFRINGPLNVSTLGQFALAASSLKLFLVELALYVRPKGAPQHLRERPGCLRRERGPSSVRLRHCAVGPGC